MNCMMGTCGHAMHRRHFLTGLAAVSGATLAGAGNRAFALTAQASASSSTDAKRTLIKNAFIYTVDGANTVIPEGWLLYQGKEIIQLGDSSVPVPEYDNVIDATGKMVLPGFVNAHWHESFIAPSFESPDDSKMPPSAYANGGNIEVLGGLFGFISSIAHIVTPEEGQAIARWSMWSQLRGGTTALGDIGSGNHWDGMANAALDLGMRLRVSRWGSDIMIPNSGKIQRIADTDQQSADWETLMSKWHDHSSGLVSGMPTVLGAFGSSDEQLSAMRDIANKYNSPFAAHIAPLKNETPSLRRVFGKSAIERFEDLGMINDRLISIHTSYASPEEFDLLVKRDVKVCHTPSHYGQLGEHSTVTGQLSNFLEAGVKLSTSTDGGVSYEGGMAEAMTAAHLMHNEMKNSTHFCPPTRALKTGTMHGAHALGWDERIGSLEPGKQADIVLVDTSDTWRYTPSKASHPLRIFLIGGGSSDIDTVIVAGETIVEEGHSTRLDETAMLADFQKAAASARSRLKPPG